MEPQELRAEKVDEEVRSAVALLVRLLANPGEEVDVTAQRHGPTLTLNVHVPRPGIVIGKGGRTITAIREVLEKVGARVQTHIYLEVLKR